MADPKRYKAVTTKDVATVAGVSPATVSKALNGRGQLRAATRTRVLAAAESLGYSGNSLSRGLLERSYTVGLLSRDSFGRLTVPVMLGIEDALVSGEMISILRRSRRRDSRAALSAHPVVPARRRHRRHGAERRRSVDAWPELADSGDLRRRVIGRSS